MDGTAHDRSDELERLFTTPGAAITVDWSFERYLADRNFVSRSALEDLRLRGPAYFRAKYIDGVLPNRSSASMAVGTLLHTRLLEPERWAEKLLVWDPLPRPAGAHGKAKKGSPEKALYDVWKANEVEWEAKRDAAIAARMTVIDSDAANQIEQMANAVLGHPYGAKVYGSGGTNEITILWHHPDTGALIRVRLDRVFPISDRVTLIVDLKTTIDPSPDSFGRSIAKFGYHTQGALYLDAAQALWPDRELRYVLTAVRSEAPYEAAFYEMAETTENGSGPLSLGREKYTGALYDYVARRESNDWVADWQTGIKKIDVPYWAYREAS